MEKEKKNITETIKEHPKTTFFVRLVFWVIFALIIPICFIGFRFELFSKKAELALSGWGVIVVIIAAIFLFVFLKYIKLGLSKKHNLFIQCLNGILKITLPLIIVFVVLYNIKNNLEYFMQALGCIILCETIAIPINPMPQWVYEQQKDVREDERKDTIDYLISKLKGNKGE